MYNFVVVAPCIPLLPVLFVNILGGRAAAPPKQANTSEGKTTAFSELEMGSRSIHHCLR